jgi:hypothetical protein
VNNFDIADFSSYTVPIKVDTEEQHTALQYISYGEPSDYLQWKNGKPAYSFAYMYHKRVLFNKVKRT